MGFDVEPANNLRCPYCGEDGFVDQDTYWADHGQRCSPFNYKYD